jgi:hypothetical protein
MIGLHRIDKEKACRHNGSGYIYLFNPDEPTTKIVCITISKKEMLYQYYNNCTTLNKVYIANSWDDSYIIIDDDIKSGKYPKTMFVTLAEYREKRIDKIFN